MTVKELIEELKKLDQDATVYACSTHGNIPEVAASVITGTYKSVLLPNMDFESEVFRGEDDERVGKYYGDKITAVRIW